MKDFKLSSHLLELWTKRFRALFSEYFQGALKQLPFEGIGSV